jgi:hypothetical protein
MGTDKHEVPGHSFRRPKDGVEHSSYADWSECNAELLMRLIAKAGSKRAALRFGYTRDGGAYSVGVYAGSTYFTDYIRPTEDINSYMAALLESFEDYLPESSDPPQRRSKRA